MKKLKEEKKIGIEIECLRIQYVPTNEIINKLDDNKLINAYDITVYTRFVNVEKTKVNELNKPISLVLKIPPEYYPKEGTIRVFSVMRIHDGEREFLKDLDQDDITVTIETNKFSEYVLCFKDYTQDEVIDVATSTQKPETGDSLNSGLWLTVIMISSFGIIVSKKRKIIK